jgi:hypothetical protein
VQKFSCLPNNKEHSPFLGKSVFLKICSIILYIAVAVAENNPLPAKYFCFQTMPLEESVRNDAKCARYEVYRQKVFHCVYV